MECFNYEVGFRVYYPVQFGGRHIIKKYSPSFQQNIDLILNEIGDKKYDFQLSSFPEFDRPDCWVAVNRGKGGSFYSIPELKNAFIFEKRYLDDYEKRPNYIPLAPHFISPIRVMHKDKEVGEYLLIYFLEDFITKVCFEESSFTRHQFNADGELIDFDVLPLRSILSLKEYEEGNLTEDIQLKKAFTVLPDKKVPEMSIFYCDQSFYFLKLNTFSFLTGDSKGFKKFTNYYVPEESLIYIQ